jgi:hypothetical protein
LCKGKKKIKFQRWWLEREDFKKVGWKAWDVQCNSRIAMGVWQFKIRNLRRLVRGWAANVTAKLNKQKQVVVVVVGSRIPTRGG